MQQMTLFDDFQHSRIVNVASVPKRSPFRYPGGKTWLVPYLRRWLSPQVRQHFGLEPIQPMHLIEPFAGGGIVGLTTVAEGLTHHVTMVEIDEDVASVWQTIFDAENWEWLTSKIAAFDLTRENVETYLTRPNMTLREQAFKTILRNRINRGGVLAPGAGYIKNGENGKGIKSRWYPATLKRRIEDIVKFREQFTFIHGDGMNILNEYAQDTHAVFFIDPPYTAPGKKAGSRLYTHSELNHEELFELVNSLRGDFLMTYDHTDSVCRLAQRYGFDMQGIPMKNSHHAEMTELLIGSNLDWLRQLLPHQFSM